jgi:hypothetical protein
VSEGVVQQLKRTGVTELMGPENIYKASDRYGAALSLAYTDAVEWLDLRGVTVDRPALLASPPPSASPASGEAK